MRLPVAAAAEPIPPTLRDGEPRHDSRVVPRGEPASQSALAGIVERSPKIIESLALAAVHHAAVGERDEAFRTLADATDLLLGVSDRAAVEHALLLVGECLVDLRSFERAVEPLEEALRLADARDDLRAGARARLALGRARLELGEAASRELLEDAGEMLEDLGDHEAIKTVEALLRRSESKIEASPRSFHWRTASSAPPPPSRR
jgi:tetratricopeptide (TPR) repeat protein